MPTVHASAEWKLPTSALNLTGSTDMSRRELTRKLHRTLTRSLSARRFATDVQAISSADSYNRTYGMAHEQSRRHLDHLDLQRNITPPAANEGPLRPNMNNRVFRYNISQKQISEEQTRIQQGYARGTAKMRAEVNLVRKQIRPAGVSTFEAGPSASYARDSSVANASELASSYSPAFITGVPNNNTYTTAPILPPSTPSAHAPRPTSGPATSATSSSPLHTTAAAAAAVPLSDDEDFSLEVSDEALATVYKNEPPPDVFVVNTLEVAQKIAARLASPELANRVFACDTEVMDIDVTKHSPCCHGRVLCFSVYCGADIDFGNEPLPAGAPVRSMLWVDTYLDGHEAKQEEALAIIEAFRPFFESSAHRKVWHNYSFDRHVMERLGINMSGFDGDTMHMARLWNSSRTGKGGYSLEALSSDEELMGPTALGDVRGKVSMKKLFGKRNIKKDGTEGKLTVLPPVHELQSGEDTKWQWVNYSAYDAKSTWDLYVALEAELKQMQATLDPAVAAAYARSGVTISSLWDLYRIVWRPFGGLLTNMEAAGMAVDRAHLAEAEKLAVKEEEEAKLRFRDWATSKVADARYMNVGSGPQVSQLLFGGAENKIKNKAGVPLERVFKVPNQLPPPDDGKKPKKNMDITLHNVWNKMQPSPLIPEIFTPSGAPACSTQVLKQLAGKPGRARKALMDLGACSDATAAAVGLEALHDDFDDALPWSTDDAEIAKQVERQEAFREKSPQQMAEIAKAKGYNKFFELFKSEVEGLAACAAVDALVDASAIDTLLSNFIVPLQSDDISKPDASGVYRVHCSLNINTETGRLSARRPNLQNQPALEKDRYKVRKAFTADRNAGKTLIVADYGQLELRILAHMANCQSMLTAFKLGGDFHSRTALGMYDNIQDAIARGDCLLEWDGSSEDGTWTPPPAPLLKDMFAAERRKAKVLNFSIAYGKTAHGLSKDWGVSLTEAEDTVKRWYSDRPEVRSWQEDQYDSAETNGYVCTILGRRRQLPDARSKNKAHRAHAMRAAINTPIQGSAADVATAAMLRIDADERLRDMGWKLLLQVHDEVILEGPKESADAAQAVVVECMRSPFGDAGGDPLRVELVVDSKYAETWYEAK